MTLKIEVKDFNGFNFTRIELMLLKKIVERERIRVLEDINIAEELKDKIKLEKLKKADDTLLGIENELDRSYSFKLS